MSGAPPGGIGTTILTGRDGVLRERRGDSEAEKNEEERAPRHVTPGGSGRRDWTRTNDPHHVKVVL